MKHAICLLAVLMMMLPAVTTAQIYKYVDKNGVEHYTDDYSQAAQNQDNGIESMVETAPPEDDAGLPDTDMESDQSPESRQEDTLPSDVGQAQTETTASQTPLNQLNEEYKRLNIIRKSLDGEMQDLREEKEGLDKLRKTAKSKEELAAYNSKVATFNDKVKNYKEKREAYDQQFKDYNAKVRADMESRLSQVQEPDETEEEGAGIEDESDMEGPETDTANQAGVADGQTRQTLEAEQASLADEYDRLIDEKNRIEKELQEPQSRSAAMTLQRQLADLNNQIKDYEKRNTDLENRIKKAEQSQEPVQTDDIAREEAEKSPTKAELEALDRRKQTLSEEKQALDAEYAELAKERERLDAARKNYRTHAAGFERQKKIDALNKRINDYEKRRQDWETRIGEYNDDAERMGQ